MNLVVKDDLYELTAEQWERINAEPLFPDETRNKRYLALINSWGLAPVGRVPKNVYKDADGPGPPLPREGT